MGTLYASNGGLPLLSATDLVGSALVALTDALDRAAKVAPGLPIMTARTLVAEHLAATKAVTPLSLERFAALWARFDRFAAAAAGVTRVADVDPALVHSFLRARTSRGEKPSPATSHLRRAALRLLFKTLRQLRLAEGDPTLDQALPRRGSRGFRSLTDDEVQLCHWASLGTMLTTRRPVVWALAEIGASTAEIGNVRLEDVDVAAGSVWLAGAQKTSARRAAFTEWGLEQVVRRLHHLGEVSPVTSLTYEGRGSADSHRTSSLETLKLVLAHAGMAGEVGVGPRSVTAWAGCRIFVATGRIDDVASGLGLRSLDLAAELIGFDWRTTPGASGL